MCQILFTQSSGILTLAPMFELHIHAQCWTGQDLQPHRTYNRKCDNWAARVTRLYTWTLEKAVLEVGAAVDYPSSLFLCPLLLRHHELVIVTVKYLLGRKVPQQAFRENILELKCVLFHHWEHILKDLLMDFG